MTEPSLSCGNLEGETYRFLWLRTFHPPIAVRLTVTQGTARILSVQLSGAGGYDPGTVVHRAEHLLPPQEWNQVRDAINVAHFWQMGAWEGKPGGLDGAQWVIEGRAGAKYHVVDRWCPESGPVRELGLLLMRLARLEIAESAIY